MQQYTFIDVRAKIGRRTFQVIDWDFNNIYTYHGFFPITSVKWYSINRTKWWRITPNARDVQQSIAFATTVRFTPMLYCDVKRKWRKVSLYENIDEKISTFKKNHTILKAINHLPNVSVQVKKIVKKMASSNTKTVEAPSISPETEDDRLEKEYREVLGIDCQKSEKKSIRRRGLMVDTDSEEEFSDALSESGITKKDEFGPNGLFLAEGGAKISSLGSIYNGKKILATYIYCAYFGEGKSYNTKRLRHRFAALGEYLSLETLQHNVDIIKLAYDDMLKGVSDKDELLILVDPEEIEFIDTMLIGRTRTHPRLSRSLQSLHGKLCKVEMEKNIRKATSDSYLDKIIYDKILETDAITRINKFTPKHEGQRLKEKYG